jgi:site-specific recombinase XerD
MNDTSLIKPIEHLPSLPNELSGAYGSNRNQLKNQQIDASNDFQALSIWLRRYDESSQTFRSYRKEINRLYTWALQALNKPFSSLTVEDIQAYLKFIANPKPFDYWCGPRRPRKDPRWKPFEGALSEASRKQALTIVGACFSFLVDAGYLSGNPVKLLSKSSRPKPYNAATVERYLDKEIWQLFWQHLLQETPKTENQQAHYERNLFIFSLLYLQSPRASEAVSHSMNSITKQHGKWWWLVTGKGGKTQRIPWKDQSMEALVRYRTFRGLSPYPSSNDNAPILAKLKGEKPITADMLYKIIKKKVKEISIAIENDHPEYAEKLSLASTHWFRHTSLTHQADDGINLRYLQAIARHESIETTQRYLHIEEETFHDTVNRNNTRILRNKKQ